VKAASDIYAPVSGQVEAVNPDLNSSPEKVNEDAYAAWMFRLRPSDPAQMELLLSAADYEKLIAAEEH
jgi:glycine cleavage system H protein